MAIPLGQHNPQPSGQIVGAYGLTNLLVVPVVIGDRNHLVLGVAAVAVLHDPKG
jgi:hypothetical protein